MFLSSYRLKHSWKFGRTQKSRETLACGLCIPQHFLFPQTFTCVSLTQTHVLYFLNNTRRLNSFIIITVAYHPCESIYRGSTTFLQRIWFLANALALFFLFLFFYSLGCIIFLLTCTPNSQTVWTQCLFWCVNPMIILHSSFGHKLGWHGHVAHPSCNISHICRSIK